jgi:5'-deoxynucleotidase YfbR-like HD superfamily hydrolase
MSLNIYISTFLGNRFYPQNPRVEDIDIEDIAHGLAYTCRFNGQTTAFYSVAQHSLMVADLVPNELKLDALMHDAAEAYLGDVVKPLKALLPEYRAIEEHVNNIIAKAFNLGDCCHPAIKRADLIALATEKRDLMPYSVEPWTYLTGIEEMPMLVDPLSPQEAKLAFMNRYTELQR